MSFDSESARLIDRIRASAFYQAKLAGANFISIDWVAKKLRRSKRWVTRNWKKKPEDCFSDFSKCGRPETLSQETKEIIGRNPFRDLLCSMPRRFRRVRDANGGETDY